MSYLYLLDTNIISDLMRNPSGKVFHEISQIDASDLCTSIVVACELHFGAQKSGSLALRQRVEQILEEIPVLPLESPIEQHYGAIRHHLESLGTPIGPNDLIIAAHARSLELTVITANVREFSRVPELSVKNWL
jgi:tRNA(fMet)-specific endonuclease VapC